MEHVDVQLLMKEASENNTLEAVRCFAHTLPSSPRQTLRERPGLKTKLNTSRSWNCSIKTLGGVWRLSNLHPTPSLSTFFQQR